MISSVVSGVQSMPENTLVTPEKINEKINDSAPKSLIFSPSQLAPQAKAGVSKCKTAFRKKGRQRTEEKTRTLIMLYRIPRGCWPDDLDYQMCLYYTKHYIRKDGKFHDIFRSWKAELEAIKGKKYRINQEIRPKNVRSRTKVLHFPSNGKASSG